MRMIIYSAGLQIPWSFAYDLGIDEVKKKWDEVLNG